MSGYIGTVPVPQATQTRNTYTATASQTTFAASYQPGFLDVYLNGVKLINGSDFTATDGSNVVLSVGAALNDSVAIVAFSTFEINSNATFAQGALADSATQPGDLATVATSGAYSDLSGTPTLGTAASSAATDFVAVTGDSMTGNLSFGDNDKAIFGAGNLQIYYDGSKSIIADAGSGNLQIRANDFQLMDAAATKNIIRGYDATGAVGLHYGGSEKLATTSSGCTITGDATATNFNTTSDQTLKTNVETLTGSLDAVKSLRGVSFDWIENGNSEVGVIAQEVEAVLPDVVSTNDEGIKSVKYSNMVAVLIEAIKEQQLRIEALETQLNS